MRAPQQFLLVLATTYGITNFVFALYGYPGLDLYISAFILEFFAITVLHPTLDNKTRRITNKLGYGLSVVFAALVVLKLLETWGVNWH